MQREQGFTIVEVLVAVIVLTVGLASLVGTGALLTRMIARGQRSSVAAMFASQRMERLRARACKQQVAGADTLYRGGSWVAINNWTFTSAPNKAWIIAMSTTYKTYTNHIRTDQSETEVSCIT